MSYLTTLFAAAHVAAKRLRDHEPSDTATPESPSKLRTSFVLRLFEGKKKSPPKTSLLMRLFEGKKKS
jgi:hypothetical protein